MKTWYFDESGQIGGDITKPNVSVNFYCALLSTESPRDIERCVKKTVRSLSERQRKKFTGTLHAYNELDSTRTKLLTLLSETDMNTMVMKVNKQLLRKTHPTLDNTELYLHIIQKLLKHLVDDNALESGDSIVLSRYFVAKRHNERLLESARALVGNDVCRIEAATQNHCLQAIDFVAWAYYTKCEKSRPEFFDLIEDKVTHFYDE